MSDSASKTVMAYSEVISNMCGIGGGPMEIMSMLTSPEEVRVAAIVAMAFGAMDEAERYIFTAKMSARAAFSEAGLPIERIGL